MKKIKKNTVNNIVNIQSKQTKDSIKIMNTDGYFEENFYFKEFFQDRELEKFIKEVEREIRKSDEYKNYIGLLNGMGITKCAVLGNVEKGDKVEVEFHHYPFTLYDITYLCISKHILKEDNFTTFDIIDEVIADHYNNIVCLVPLCTTVHQLVHDGIIFVNLKATFGYLDKFLEKYEEVMDDNMIAKYNKIVEYSNKNIQYSESDILKKL